MKYQEFKKIIKSIDYEGFDITDVDQEELKIIGSMFSNAHLQYTTIVAREFDKRSLKSCEKAQERIIQDVITQVKGEIEQKEQEQENKKDLDKIKKKK